MNNNEKKETTPFISVIIPCYNVERELLERSVDSVLGQTFRELEVILVDDGSIAPYDAFVREAAKKDPRIVYLAQSNSGVSSARNAGVNRAKGEYIAFLDADDSYVPYFCEEAYDIAKKQDADFVIGEYQSELPNIGVVPQRKESPEIIVYEDPTTIEQLKNSMVSLNRDCEVANVGRACWCRLIKTEVARQIRFCESVRIGEDLIWNIDVLAHCHKVCIANQKWYLYYQYIDSVIHIYNPKRYEDALLLISEVRNRMNLKEDDAYIAYCDLVFGQLSAVGHRYIENSAYSDGRKNKKQLKRKLYTELPWREIISRRYYSSCTFKRKIRVICYWMRCYFILIKIKKLLCYKK